MEHTYQDLMVSSIGGFGRSQLIIVVLTKMATAIAGFSMVMMSFTGFEPDWWSLEKGFNQTGT